MVSNPLTDGCYGPAEAAGCESIMHLVCPKCATSYQLDAATVGVEGRSVRCARCKNVWFAAVPEPQAAPAHIARDEAAFREELGFSVASAAPEERTLADRLVAAAGTPEGSESPAASGAMNEPAGNNPPESSAATEAASEPSEPQISPADSALTVPAMDSPPLAPAATDGGAASSASTIPSEPGDIESVAARRMPHTKSAARRRLATSRSRLPLAMLALVAVCTVIIGWRKDIVRHMPQMASFYGAIGLPVNVRGIIFNDVRLANDTHDGVPVLTIEGTLASVVSAAVEVPRLRFALRNGAGQEVYSWTAMPAQTVLAPGETLPFRSRLASPPGDVHDMHVRFFSRRDAAAGAN